MKALVRAAISWLIASAAACSETFGPDSSLTPELTTIRFNDLSTSLRHGGLLYVNAEPMDTTFRLDADQRVPVILAVTSGDLENVGLYRLHCPPRERGSGYHCFTFIIGMQDGYDASQLAGRVADEGGRFHLISISGRFAGVTLFNPEHLVARARHARSWPGVATTELSFPFCIPDAPPACGSLSQLTVPAPVDTGAAKLGDGIVQVRPGDTVSVTYQQPDGSTLRATRVVP